MPVNRWLASVYACNMLFVQVFVFHVVVIDSPKRFIQCTTYGSFSSRWQETLYNMLTFSFLLFLPLFIMITCYSRILFEISKKMTEDSCKFYFDKNISNGNFLISLQVTWPSGVFALTLLCVICHANVLLLLWSLSHSAVQQSAAAQVKKQHPQGTHAHAEDDCGHCAVIHGMLDTLLHAWPVVLVLSRWPGGNSVPVSLTHPFYIRPVKCLFGPHHLWSLHHSTMHEA